MRIIPSIEREVLRYGVVFSDTLTVPPVYGKPLFYTATHGRVTATAPTMWEAIVLCTNGVYQATYIK